MSNKKDTKNYETLDNTVQEGYSAHGEYAAQQGEYDYTDPNQYYNDPNQYYTDPNQYHGYNNYTDTSNTGYSYDQYYQQYYDTQSAGYDANAYNNAYYNQTDTTLPESVANIVANSASTTKPSKYTNNTGAATASITASVSAPNPYYANANSNNPQLPIVISKTGYTGPNSTLPTSTTPTTATTTSSSQADSKKKGKQKKLVRQAGGELWEDNSLLEWDDNDFRLFAGDLGNEVTDELLYKAFSKYPSLLRTRVVRDKRTLKSKGFGFISFRDPDDFVRAWREMNGKYVGNRPIKLRKSNWKERNIDVRAKKERERVGPYPKIR
ncbi:RNA-binding domain-containing protein [Backusella circina FSU 941]|nr:RNA-binding domain-containing protein [Backusella circina FSU 941]